MAHQLSRSGVTGLPMDALTERLGSRARALATRRWLFGAHPVPSALPALIPGVAGGAWSRLREEAPLPPWRLAARTVSAGGTVKYALDFAGAVVEAVLIPGRGRSTVCVSSQAGCSRSCTFCATATLGFGRQLSASEIVLQYLVARAEAPPDAPARNVVFMGMGEPLDNLEAVLAAVNCLTDAGEPRLARRQVTVSTSGVLPAMSRFLSEGRANLALSLNATTDAQRERLIPHTRLWPITDLLSVLRADQAAHPKRRSFIGYVLWDGVNDSDEDASRLLTLLQGLRAVVNLIPHNAFPGNRLVAARDERVVRFQTALQAGGVRCLVRRPRGREIGAACGQLALLESLGSPARVPSP